MSFKKDFSADPVSAVANAVSDVAVMVTKALPSEEEQLARFKLNYPIIYARRMQRLYNRAKTFLRWHHGVGIDTHIDLVNGNLADSTRALLKKELHEDLGR